MGIDATKAVERARSKSKSRGRSSKRNSDPTPSVGAKRRRDQVDFSPGEGLRDERVSFYLLYLHH